MRFPNMAVGGTLLPMLVVLASCNATVRQPLVHDPAVPISQSKSVNQLKVHLRSGRLDILNSWRFEGDTMLVGSGSTYSVDRLMESQTDQRIPLDSIALLETDSPQNISSLGLTALNVWTVVWGSLTTACVLDPKSCFGSCPTFYVDGMSRDRPVAEGFSSSVARALEASDVDDIDIRRRGGSNITMRMMNEAWETHAVRWVKLHAVPVEKGSTVLATPDGLFHTVRGTHAPNACTVHGADCTREVSTRDTLEWRDVTDSLDLAAPDTVVLTFAPQPGQTAFVLGARQAFVSTYALYQTMAYMGRGTGEWLASLERRDPAALVPLAAVNQAIGVIAIAVQDKDGGWRSVGQFAEAGPIAHDVELFPLPTKVLPTPHDDSIRVRLLFAKGNWRIGYAALAELGGVVQSISLDPVQVRRVAGKDGGHGDLRAMLVDTARYLNTFPGDAFALTFELPSGAPEYAVFLETRGYYYEWMRGEWLAEQDDAMAQLLTTDPRSALRQMAPGYKALEATYEQNFWNSRFGRQP